MDSHQKTMLMNSEISTGAITPGKANAVNREVLRHAMELAKKNKHLFVKDYSSFSGKDQFILDSFSHF